MTGISWRVVDRYSDAIAANIVRGRLEAEGIPAVLGNEDLVTLNWLWSQAFGGVVVKVPAELLDAARAIIAAIDHGDYADAMSAETGDVCDQCGAKLELTNFGVTREIALATTLGLGIPLPFIGPRYVCPKCR